MEFHSAVRARGTGCATRSVGHWPNATVSLRCPPSCTYRAPTSPQVTRTVPGEDPKWEKNKRQRGFENEIQWSTNTLITHCGKFLVNSWNGCVLISHSPGNLTFSIGFSLCGNGRGSAKSTTDSLISENTSNINQRLKRQNCLNLPRSWKMELRKVNKTADAWDSSPVKE